MSVLLTHLFISVSAGVSYLTTLSGSTFVFQPMDVPFDGVNDIAVAGITNRWNSRHGTLPLNFSAQFHTQTVLTIFGRFCAIQVRPTIPKSRPRSMVVRHR